MINKVSLLCLSGHGVHILEEEEENVGANWEGPQAAGWTGTKPVVPNLFDPAAQTVAFKSMMDRRGGGAAKFD